MRDAPVYIVGPSGSGKTQLRRLLGTHPRLSLTRKTYLWSRYYGRFGDLGDDAALRRCLDRMLDDPDVDRLAPEPGRIIREFRSGPASYAHLFSLLHRHHAERAGKPRWGEQFGPGDRFAPQIFDGFPAARVVHMVPDARARSALISPAMRARIRTARSAARNQVRFGDHRYLTIPSDAFASDPVGVLSVVCRFIGEDVPDGLVRLAASDGSVRTG